MTLSNSKKASSCESKFCKFSTGLTLNGGGSFHEKRFKNLNHATISLSSIAALKMLSLLLVITNNLGNYVKCAI